MVTGNQNLLTVFTYISARELPYCVELKNFVDGGVISLSVPIVLPASMQHALIQTGRQWDIIPPRPGRETQALSGAIQDRAGYYRLCESNPTSRSPLLIAPIARHIYERIFTRRRRWHGSLLSSKGGGVAAGTHHNLDYSERVDSAPSTMKQWIDRQLRTRRICKSPAPVQSH